MTAEQVQIRRDTAANLTAATPASGELGYDTTNKRLVIGDGTTAGGTKVTMAKDHQNQTYVAGTVGGTGDAITLTNSPVVAAYAVNQRFSFKAGAANTGAVTLNVDSLGAKDVKKMNNGALAALVADDIVSGGMYDVMYDGTQFQIKAIAEGPYSSGSKIYLDTQEASASAVLDFTSKITSAYDVYEFDLIDLRPASDGQSMQMRTSTDNTNFDAGASDYVGRTVTAPINATDAETIAINTSTAIFLTPSSSVGSAASEGVSGTVRLINPLGTTRRKMIEFKGHYETTAGVTNKVETNAYRAATSDIDAVRFLFASANITSGKIHMYGIKNS